MTEMLSASTEFVKGGYTEEQSASLAKVASLYQNVADSELSAGESASFIISQLKAFNISASESIQIIDKINELSNLYAVSSTDISTALTKTASTFSTYGNSIDETMAMVVGATELLPKQAGKVSKGLSSIGAEIVKLANKTGELTYKVNGSTKSMSLFNEQGEMLNTFETLSGIKDDWDKMTKAEQSSLALMLGMKTQIPVFTAEMNNFDTVLKAVGVSVNSNGSAMEENSRYMESLEAKTAKLRAEFEKLVLGDGGLQSFAKGVVDTGTALLKFANSDVGQVIIETTALITVLNLATKAYKGLEIASTISAIYTQLTQKTIALAGGMGVMVVGTKSLTVGLLELASAWLLTPMGMATVAVGGILLIANAIKKNEQAISDMKDEVKALGEEIDVLNTKDKLTQAEQDRLVYLQKRLDLEQKILAVKTQQSRPSSEKEQSMMQSYNRGSLGSNYQATSPTTPQITTVEDTASAYAKLRSEIENFTGTSQSELNILEQKQTKSEEYLTTLTKERDELIATAEKNEYLGDRESERLAYLENLIGKQQEATDELTSYSDAISNYGEGSEEASEYLEDLADSVGLSTEELVANADAMGISVDKYAEFVDGMNNFNESIDSIQDSYDTLKSAMEEYNETGAYSLDTVQKMLALSPEYLSMLKFEGGQISINEQAIRDKVTASAEEAKQTIYNNTLAKLNAIEMANVSEAMKIAKGNIDSTTESIKTNSTALSENTVQAVANAITQGSQSKADAVNKVMSQMKSQIALIDSTVSGLGSNFEGSMGKATSSTSKASSAVDKLQSSVEDLLKEQLDREIDDLKEAEEDEIKVLEDRKDLLESNKEIALDSIDKQISAIEKLKQAEEDRADSEIDALESRKKSVEAYYDAEIAKLEQANTELDRNNKLAELQQNLALAKSTKVMVMGESGQFEYREDEGAVASAEQELADYQAELAIETQIEKLQAMKDSAVASIDAQISKWEEYKTTMSNNYATQIAQLETYRQTVEDNYTAEIEALDLKIETTKAYYEQEIELKEQYKEYVDEYVESLNQAEQRQLENQLNAIKQTASNYSLALENFREYASKYNEIKAQLGSSNTAISTNTTIGVKARASGDASIGESGTYLIGEKPNTELVIGSKANGQLMNLSKGTGVVNAESTKTIAGLFNTLSKYSGISGTTGESISNIMTGSTDNSKKISINNLTIKANNPSEFEGWATSMLQTAYGN